MSNIKQYILGKQVNTYKISNKINSSIKDILQINAISQVWLLDYFQSLFSSKGNVIVMNTGLSIDDLSIDELYPTVKRWNMHGIEYPV